MKTFLIALMLLLTCQTVYAVPIPLRGVVEGFYGATWTFEERADILNFCRQHNLNYYIYAPKDDPYHRDKWRTPYPANELADLKALVERAQAYKVRFIFAVSPGLDLNYSGSKGEQDFKTLIRKLESLYQIGVRDFAIFFDDLKDAEGNHHENGKLQAKFLNRVQKYLRTKYKDVAPLITVPTEYFYEDMIKGNKLKPYTRDLAENLDDKIVVLYSGKGVVCPGISDSELAKVNEIFNREVGIWWNYPVNDYSLTPDGNRNVKLALGAIENLPTAHVTAVFFNPMQQVQLSKVALTTGAIYTNNPAEYNPDLAWDIALAELFGELNIDFKNFAMHSRHMENSWAKCGPPDDPEFNAEVNNILADLKHNRKPDFSTLERRISQIDNSIDRLLYRLPQKYLVECKPQLQQLKRILHADKVAIQSLKAGKLDPQLKSLREEIAANESEAVLSELVARRFIDEVLKYFSR